MTLFDFIDLPFDERLNAMLCGNLIANRAHKNGICQLYVLDGFFVEILYNLRDFRILKLQPILLTTALDPYLAQISLDDLFVR